MSDTDEQNLNPLEGCVLMHNGSTLFWEQNAAGGRTYTSDEVAAGVLVWDTCLVDFGSICEAYSIEIALQGVERRATLRRERARADKAMGQPHHGHDDGPDELRSGYVRADFPNLAKALNVVRDVEAAKAVKDLTHGDITLRVFLRRAQSQLRRYSEADPMAAEIERLLDEEPRK